ncbi:hypothetical protein [Nostoc sp. TCL26-01]|uniref:hypothetical protein n=1 Tax=Nostoc sp. TCL26-01 TaxID=2576904 RepID=UPI0015BCD735|nr:hypothetical protein [Nostoc sp. TCL26-01]QLE59080.1 hypothetical protein FD725_28445 [Nostoc sp. TCL26-01]
MNSTIGGVITLSVTLLLTMISLASAETPTRSIRNSQILPYLLDNPHENSLVRVRCVPRIKQEVNRKRSVIRDSLLRPNIGNNDSVTIEIAGSCHNLRIRVQQNESGYSSYPAYTPDLDEYDDELEDGWLIREGSGWHWLLRNQK